MDADIDCGVVSIRGTVTGRVHGRERIELLAGSQVQATLVSPKLRHRGRGLLPGRVRHGGREAAGAARRSRGRSSRAPPYPASIVRSMTDQRARIRRLTERVSLRGLSEQARPRRARPGPGRPHPRPTDPRVLVDHRTRRRRRGLPRGRADHARADGGLLHPGGRRPGGLRGHRRRQRALRRLRDGRAAADRALHRRFPGARTSRRSGAPPIVRGGAAQAHRGRRACCWAATACATPRSSSATRSPASWTPEQIMTNAAGAAGRRARADQAPRHGDHRHRAQGGPAPAEAAVAAATQSMAAAQPHPRP